MTPTLFHGPEARDAAVRLSEEVGHPLSDPVGDTGLKVDDSRIIVALARQPGVGDKPPSLVVGPLDQATPEASDALLKTLEDLTEAPLRLILWADYLTGVIPTIRSRTWAVWCPPSPTYLSPVSYMNDQAEALCEALLAGDEAKMIDRVVEAEKDWPDLLQALCVHLCGHLEDPHVIEAWVRIRKVLDGKGSPLVAVNALISEVA
jgi:hypothetical protein